jgi:hypothetical protein
MSRAHCLVPISDEKPDIESALQKIDEVASNQEGIAAEEALILRGYVFSHVQRPHELSKVIIFKSPSPQPDQLDAYTDALERLNANIAFGSAEESQRDTVRIRYRLFPPLFSQTLVSRRDWLKPEPRSWPNCSQSSLRLARRAVILLVRTSNTPHSLVMNSRPCHRSSSSSALFPCQQLTRPISPQPPSCQLSKKRNAAMPR